MRDIQILLMAVLAAASMPANTNAHGGDPAKIHACVRGSAGANSGAIRIVGANETCRTGETPLDWPRDQNTGDVTGVLAGVGLAGGGNSGQVTLDVAVPLSLSGSDPFAVIRGNNSGTPGEGEAAGVWGDSVNGTGVFGSGGMRGVVGISRSVGVAGGSSDGTGVLASGKIVGLSAYVPGPCRPIRQRCVRREQREWCARRDQHSTADLCRGAWQEPEHERLCRSV